MKSVTINGKEYKIEFSIEASLYEDCSGCIMDYFINAGLIDGAAQTGDTDRAVDSFKKALTSIPQRALTLFYAGLMENQPEITKERAKFLLKEYIKESGKSFSDVLNEMLKCVEEDSFFEMIGLDKMFQNQESNTKKKKEEHGENTSTEQ